MITRSDLIKSLTESAGKKLLEYYKKELIVTQKSEIDFALEADLKIEEYIIGEIKKYFPDDSILSEEAGEDLKQSDYFWIIDPLDGTANFKAEIPYFCSTIALQFKGEIVVAGVYDPINSRMFFAEKGRCAFLNEERIHVSDVSEMRKFLISYSTSNHKNQNMVKRGAALFHYFLSNCRAVRLQGSSILDLCNVAIGVFDGLVKIEAQYWDFAAGCLIVEEAGGRATDFKGNAWSQENNNIFASNGIIHEAFIENLQTIYL